MPPPPPSLAGQNIMFFDLKKENTVVCFYAILGQYVISAPIP
jgi:hypothetical protein